MSDVMRFRAMWNNREWSATQVGEIVYLTRMCTGCWSESRPGLWSTSRHTVEETVSVAIIGDRLARIERLRAAGESEAADVLSTKAWRQLTPAVPAPPTARRLADEIARTGRKTGLNLN